MIRLHRRQRPYLWIGVLLVVVEAALTLVGHWVGNPVRLRLWAVEFAGFWPGLLGDWQSNYRLQPATMFATYWVLHSGPAHLLGNLLIMGWFAHRIGPDLRRTETWEIWAASVLGGGVAFGLLSGSISPMVGASGGVFGLLGAFAVIDHMQIRRQAGMRAAILRSSGLCAMIVILSFVDFVLRNALLAWEAHLGGFLAGAALTLAIAPKVADAA